MLLRYGLGLAALAAVAFFFVRERALFAGFGATLGHLNWAWVVVAFAAELASVPPLAEAQRKVLAAAGVASDRARMNLVTLASNAISASVPAGVAVAEGYSFVRYRRFGADTAVAAWSELAIGAINFCALATLALAGAVIAGSAAESILLPLLGVVVAGSGGAALLFRHPRFMLRTLDWTGAHLGQVGRLLGRLTQGLLDALCLALSFAAVHARVPWGRCCWRLRARRWWAASASPPAGSGSSRPDWWPHLSPMACAALTPARPCWSTGC